LRYDKRHEKYVFEHHPDLFRHFNHFERTKMFYYELEHRKLYGKCEQFVEAHCDFLNPRLVNVTATSLLTKSRASVPYVCMVVRACVSSDLVMLFTLAA